MNDRFHLIVIGAGPRGIAVGAAAKKAGAACVLFDKGCVTSSLMSYPYYMTFFSTAVMLEVGDVPFTIPDAKPSRREALAYYRRVVERWEMDVRQYQEVTSVRGREGDFTLETRKADGTEETYHAASVVVATGIFDEPNLLGVPGEDLDRVHHYYHEPYAYHDQDVLVERFRNGARVTMVHFLDKIDRGVKPWVVPDITNRLERGEIGVHWNSRVVEIRASSVILRDEATGTDMEIHNDFVVAMTGWRADHTPLRALGVEIDPETGIPTHDKCTMLTNVPGLYIAGVIAAGHNANKIFIENGREHGELIVSDVLTASGGS